MVKKTTKEKLKRFLITLTNPKSPFAEQYRTVRTNIQFSSIDKKIKSILVTSSEPSEGKTTTIANLAITYAQQEKKVLLVDADLRKPQLHSDFKLENFKGLTTAIAQEKSLKDVIQKTDISNLSILTSGPIPPNPSELLSSEKMKKLIAQMYEQYDVILFDAPPLLAVTDAQIISQVCDGTILVVRRGYSAKEKIKKAKELLTLVNANILGVVLNRAEQDKDGYYDYYGSEK
ncbi:CpsD/CapB family tyrosine-protein kinase [Bacillus sp. AFS029533]|uniref:CpsD/CapB family tyrosine-protein kinase n=1 Tax=Bacillus sp. AFS029533 TaxID=2033494 RepID=UPI000BFB4A6C|nr:CpsD/CapB family tyrosine-protein kinase [Bacillus sp. AFS029533]PGZ91719.1 capsular biosynthesis protein [Bacillus sp. AFS029533]